MATVGENFYQDLTRFKETYEEDEEQVLCSYIIYMCLQDKEGHKTHMQSCNTYEIDQLLGRLRLLEALVLENYNKVIQEKDEQILPNLNINEILNKFKIDKNNKPN